MNISEFRRPNQYADSLKHAKKIFTSRMSSFLSLFILLVCHSTIKAHASTNSSRLQLKLNPTVDELEDAAEMEVAPIKHETEEVLPQRTRFHVIDDENNGVKIIKHSRGRIHDSHESNGSSASSIFQVSDHQQKQHPEKSQSSNHHPHKKSFAIHLKNTHYPTENVTFIDQQNWDDAHMENRGVLLDIFYSDRSLAPDRIKYLIYICVVAFLLLLAGMLLILLAKLITYRCPNATIPAYHSMSEFQYHHGNGGI